MNYTLEPQPQNPYVLATEKYSVTLQLSPSEIQTVRTTWAQMLQDINYAPAPAANNDSDKKAPKQQPRSRYAGSSSSLFCDQLYRNLLGLAPDLETLFPSIKHLAASFAGVLRMTVLNLEDLRALDDYLDALGKRHSRILGIEPVQFDLMGAAFIKTFADRFGRGFTLQAEDAWAKVYLYLANTMLANGAEDTLALGHMDEELDWGMDLDRQLSTVSSLMEDGNESFTSSSSTSLTEPSTVLKFMSVDNSDAASIRSTANFLPKVGRGGSRLTSRKASAKNLKEQDSNNVGMMSKSPSKFFPDMSSIDGVSTKTGDSSTASERDIVSNLSSGKKMFQGFKSAMGLPSKKRLSTAY